MNKDLNVNNQQNSQEIISTVSNVVEELVDSTEIPVSTAIVNAETVQCLNSKQQTSNNIENVKNQGKSTVVREQPRYTSTYEIYRSAGQFAESRSDIEVDNIPCNRIFHEGENSQGISAVPPSYSTVIKQGRPSLDIRRDARSMEIEHVSSFSRRIPPPSYAEIQGVWSREFSNTSSEMILFGPEPIYIWCTRCATVVVTVTHSQRSKFTHFTAAALCLFGCWPCAMLPYFMNTCKNTYHYCPDCNYLFGMYRPW